MIREMRKILLLTLTVIMVFSGTVLAGYGISIENKEMVRTNLIQQIIGFVKLKSQKKTCNESKRLVHLFCFFLQQLPPTARDHGRRVHVEDIKENTVFVSRLVSQMVKEKVRELHIDHLTLTRLYLQACKYQIKPLVNGFAAEIVNEIPYSRDINTQLETRGFGRIPYCYIKPIWKFVYFKARGIRECSIADWIALHGQPEVLNGCLYLNGKGITSLDGIDLIHRRDRITEIDFEDNEIIGCNLDTDFPSKPFSIFPNLRELSLANNSLKAVPYDMFYHLNKLDSLNLSHNYLCSLPDTLFRDLRGLTHLSLFDNHLSLLSRDQFAFLWQLTTLDLARNRLVSLPRGLFRKQFRMECISLKGNLLRDVPEMPRFIDPRFYFVDEFSDDDSSEEW